MKAAVGAPVNARSKLAVKPKSKKKQSLRGKKKAVKTRKRRGKNTYKKIQLPPEQPQPQPQPQPPQQPQQPQQSEQTTRTYEHGYSDGLFDGGEKFVEQHHPGDLIIPDLSVEGAVAAGMQTLRAHGVLLLGPDAVAAELESSLREKRPYAFIRLGDGELMTLAQEVVLPIEEIQQAGGHFLPYAGVNIPDPAARETVAHAIRHASLVGVPISRRPYYQPLLFKALRAHGIDTRSLRYTSSVMNYTLHEHGHIMRLMSGRRVLLVGNVADRLAHALVRQGILIVGAVLPVNGVHDAPRVIEEASRYDFDLALVSAGIAALPICVNLAAATGKVMIDFGHLANHIAGLSPT